MKDNEQDKLHKQVFNDKSKVSCQILYFDTSITPSQPRSASLLVERLGEGGGGSDVGIAGSLVGTSGLLEGLSLSKVRGALGLVGSGVVGLKVDIVEKGEHFDVGLLVSTLSAQLI